jgi:hypothetical protein
MSRERLEQMRDRIIGQVFGHWWVHCMAGTQEAVPHLDGALAAAGVVQGRLVQAMLPGDGQVPCDSGGLRTLRSVVNRQGGSVLLSQCLAELFRD